MRTWFPSARVAIIVIGMAMIFRAMHTVAVQPILTSLTKISRLRLQVGELESKLAPHRRRTLELSTLRRRSVASDTSLVSLAYQEQLLKHAEHLGIDNLSVKPSRPQPLGAVGSIISMSVHASATATQLGAVLDFLEQSKALHRIPEVTITPSETRGLLKAVVRVEAIALKEADPQANLWPTKSLEDRLSSSFATQKLLCRYVPPPPPKPIPIPPPAKTITKMVVVNPLNSIRFVGSLTAGSQRQAWFVNTKTNEEFVVEELGSVEFGGLAVRVHAITNDFVEIRVNDQPARIDIGQRLAK